MEYWSTGKYCHSPSPAPQCSEHNRPLPSPRSADKANSTQSNQPLISRASVLECGSLLPLLKSSSHQKILVNSLVLDWSVNWSKAVASCRTPKRLREVHRLRRLQDHTHPGSICICSRRVNYETGLADKNSPTVGNGRRTVPKPSCKSNPMSSPRSTERFPLRRRILCHINGGTVRRPFPTGVCHAMSQESRKAPGGLIS
jgi:hypothetical protein